MDRCLFLQRLQQCIKLLLLIFFTGLHSDPLRLNNADPYPLFTSQGGHNYLCGTARRHLAAFEDDEEYCIDEDDLCWSDRLSVSVTPFYQSASHGADYRGRDAVTVINNENFPEANSPASTGESTGTPYVTKQVKMPLGAIPEPFNMLGLFYPHEGQSATYQSDKFFAEVTETVNNEEQTLGATQDGTPLEVAFQKAPYRILARKLGFTHTPLADAASNDEDPVGPLQYGYFNYYNRYFNVLAYPPSRDPQRLFGYGYFDYDYAKYGVRTCIEAKITPGLGLKIYGGVAHVEVDKVNLLDTTTKYQGPSAANMLVRYPNQWGIQDDTGTGDSQGGYNEPNAYQLTTYSRPDMLGYSQTGGGDRGQSDYSFENPSFPNQLKSQYLQNIQNNLREIEDTLNFDFGPYHKTQPEDLTFELYYKALAFYNHGRKDDKMPPYVIMPVFSGRITVPLSEPVYRKDSNDQFGVDRLNLFARSVANNGHLEAGGTAGFIIDFLNTISFGCDFGVSWYKNRTYDLYPVPTNSLQEGLYPYLAEVERNPGTNMSLGLSIQGNHFLDNLSFYGEYRLIKHNTDTFKINEIFNPFPLDSVEDLEDAYIKVEQNPKLSIPPSSAERDSAPDGSEIPLADGVFGVDDPIYIEPGCLLIQEEAESERLEEPPMPDITDVDTKHMRDTSSWTVHMARLSLNYDINEYTSLGVAWQQPFSVTNAFSTGTLVLSLDMRV